MTDHLSQDVFDVITSSTPKIQEAGWRMLQTLLEQKMMSVDTIVPSTGKKLFEGLVEHILSHHKGVHPMFSRKGVQQWLKATDGRAFSLPNSQGGWLPFQVLATIASWDAKQKRDKEIGATALDGWMTAVLPLLPPQAWEGEDASAALTHALGLKMNTPSRLIWEQIPLAARPIRVARALPAASVGWVWPKFLAEGGDPMHIVEGRPLWQVLLGKFSMTEKQGAEGLPAALEQWMFQSIADNTAPPGARQFIEKLFRKRGTGVSFTGEEWMKMLQRVPLDWTLWKDPSGEAWWKTPARRCGLPWFDALESSPDVLARLDPLEVVTARFGVLLDKLSSRSAPADGASRMVPLCDHVKQHGWPPGPPFVLQFCTQSLAKLPERRQLQDLAESNSVAWWGDCGNRAQVEREAVTRLTQAVAIDVQDWRTVAQTWQAATRCQHPGPWLEVVGGVVTALCGGNADLPELELIDSALLAQVCQDPDAPGVFQSFAKRASKKQVPAFDRFIKRIQIESALAPLPPRMKSPRF